MYMRWAVTISRNVLSTWNEEYVSRLKYTFIACSTMEVWKYIGIGIVNVENSGLVICITAAVQQLLTQYHSRPNKAFTDIRLCSAIATPLVVVGWRSAVHALPDGPLRPNMTSSIKPEVHNVSKRCHRRTEPRPQGSCTKNFVKIGSAVPEICSRTDRHTHRQTH